MVKRWTRRVVIIASVAMAAVAWTGVRIYAWELSAWALIAAFWCWEATR